MPVDLRFKTALPSPGVTMDCSYSAPASCSQRCENPFAKVSLNDSCLQSVVSSATATGDKSATKRAEATVHTVRVGSILVGVDEVTNEWRKSRRKEKASSLKVTG